MAQALSITNAIKASGFTATGLADALQRVTEVAVTSEAQARVKVILDGLCNLTLSDGGKLLSEAVKAVKDTKAEKTVKVRASEARQIFGTVKARPEMREKIENAGWHGGVKLARDTLASMGIKWNLAKIQSPEERQAKQIASTAESIIQAEILAADGDDQRTIGQLAEMAKQKAAATLTAEKVAAHANRIMKGEGKEYGIMLAEALLAWTPEAETK